MEKAKEISALWSQIKPQIGELVRLCHEIESHAEVTADAYQRGYEAGLNDAWEAARKIACDRAHGGFCIDTKQHIFGAADYAYILANYNASEAVEKIRAYEQEKQFCVGDEFEIESGKRFVIVKMDGTEIDKYIDEEGQTYGMYAKYNVMRKTGRHFPEIAEVLRKIREDSDG